MICVNNLMIKSVIQYDYVLILRDMILSFSFLGNTEMLLHILLEGAASMEQGPTLLNQ